MTKQSLLTMEFPADGRGSKGKVTLQSYTLPLEVPVDGKTTLTLEFGHEYQIIRQPYYGTILHYDGLNYYVSNDNLINYLLTEQKEGQF